MNVQSQHHDLVNTVANRYRQDGYEVQIEPPPNAVPFDLGGYRPDLIARKEDVALLIEVKEQPGRTSFERLRAVVDEVSHHSGWQFVLVTAKDIANGLPADGQEQLSWDEIDSRTSRAQRLVRAGEPEAAYLMLWIAFEQALRLHARQTSMPIDRLSPQTLIRELYSHGELSMSQFDASLACQTIRNRIAHGLPAGDLNADVARLTSLLQDVLEQWRNPVRDV